MTTATVTEVLETIRTLSPEEKDEVQRGMQAMSVEDVFVPTAEQEADIERGLTDIEAGRTMSLEEFRRTMLHQL